MFENRDAYEPDDEPLPPSRKESNFTVLTINEIMDEQMNQINRISELFEVRSGGCFTHSQFRFDLIYRSVLQAIL